MFTPFGDVKQWNETFKMNIIKFENLQEKKKLKLDTGESPLEHSTPNQ